jgi:GT2 family glycosyltransferase
VTPELSVLIVNYNTWRECAAAVRSLRRNPPMRADGSAMPYECIVVDNDSPLRPPEDVALLRQALAELAADCGDPDAAQLVLHGENSGYSKGVNLCFRRSRGRWILVSNPDLLFPRDCISALLRHLERHPDVGCVVPKGYWDEEFEGKLPPNTLPTLLDLLVSSLGEFFRPLRRRYGKGLVQQWLRIWEAQQPIELRMMSGCLFLMERGYFESIGLMDERFPLYYEDADLSRRIRRSGKKLVQVPDARLVHFVNRSGQTDLTTMMTRHDISRDLYFRKWYGWLGGFVHARINALLRSPFGRRRIRVPPDTPFVDLGSSAEPPVLRFRRCERYLLLVSLDSRFHLSGGLVGVGDSWTPSAGVFANFSATTYWCRVYDLTGGRLEPIGTWRYDCRRHLGQALPQSTAPAPVPAPRDVGAASASG